MNRIANQAAAVDPPIVSQFHIVHYWRRATAQRRWAAAPNFCVPSAPKQEAYITAT